MNSNLPEAPRAQLKQIPDGLMDVAMIDGATSAAACGVSISQWHSLVKEGKAPKPAVRSNRFTRWRLADVRGFLVKLQEDAASDLAGASAIVDRAKKASTAAAKRRAESFSVIR